MKKPSEVKLEQFLDEKAIEFNKRRIELLRSITVDDLLQVTPFIYQIDQKHSVVEISRRLVDNRIEVIEEQLLNEIFGDILYKDEETLRLIIRKIEQYDSQFGAEQGATQNRLFAKLYERVCDSTGQADWLKLVEFNSGNYDLNKFLP